MIVKINYLLMHRKVKAGPAALTMKDQGGRPNKKSIERPFLIRFLIL